MCAARGRYKKKDSRITAEFFVKKPCRSKTYRAFAFGGESGIRTPDLRIMIPSL